uniref:Zinc metalloproteinase-disintegrin-like ohanin n=1 Tax=Ophiophagus hannah TaxID=8665 RepID=VM3_OPHHA|nr:RecName: Full=Zinc metalloproteinase-disintegrin-like ohanin; AltName: Full=Snake venom metalloproteinase; Short=SVMP; Flags: Precursor [Ophiophagus hannah]ABM87941.1 metalloproteinase [Ophiophagus hannah]
MIQVLLVTICLVVFPYQGSSIILESGKVNDYEVVYPQKIPVLPKSKIQRREQKMYEDTMKYEFKVNGEPVVLHLERNKELFSKDYTETHYSPDGREITTSPPVEDHCYYHGYIQSDIDSTAILNACNGLKGYFRHHGEAYHIEPLKFSDSEAHAVYKYENIEKEDETPKICGVKHSTWESDEPIEKISQKKDFLEEKKYLELYIVADYVMFRKYGRNVTTIRMRVFDMVNYITVVYKALNIHVALIGFEIWSLKDKFVINASTKNNLLHFSIWRSTVLRKRNDNAQLLTGVDLNGYTLGSAYLKAMCDVLQSVGIVQDYSKSPYLVGAAMAHEIGHNLGMEHDTKTCSCMRGNCIMSPEEEGSDFPMEFSSCSLYDFQNYMLTDTPQCLINKPSNTSIIKNAVCGNYVEEEGEECDCGSPEQCENNCCEAATCKLKPGAKCAKGACCKKCQFKKAGAECRAARNECDLPEFCIGQSAECPMDRFHKNGHSCQNDQGYCFRGYCPTLAKQCITLWGSDAKVAPDECFQNNTNGNEYDYCKKTNNVIIPCKPTDVKCGRLYCTGGTENPSEGEKISSDPCKASYSEIEDIGMVDHRTKCGEKMVCSDGKCIPL